MFLFDRLHQNYLLGGVVFEDFAKCGHDLGTVVLNVLCLSDQEGFPQQLWRGQLPLWWWPLKLMVENP